MSKKIFINYSWEHDAENALKIYRALSDNKKFKVWMDKKSMEGGLQWKPAIRKAIREADFFISILSKKSTKGRGVRNKEIYEALDVLREFPQSEVYLIPARIDDCTPPFDEMKDLNWIDFFPDWENGLTGLLNALGVAKPVKSKIKLGEKKIDTSKYHYRVGLVDIDMGLVNMNEIASQLNKIQNYFLFTLPVMPSLNEITEVFAGIKNFAVYKVPHTYISEHPHLAVDLLACITKYPLAFKEENQFVYNYFAGPSDEDERFLFISADNLYEYCRKAGCVLEEGIVSVLVSQLVAYFTEIGYHYKTKKCVMDFCENREDLIFSLKTRHFCKDCNSKLSDGPLKESFVKLLNWKYQ
jgi:hypothetical protein